MSGWTINVVVYLAMISSIMLREGINGVITLIYATICFVPYTVGRICRKAKQIGVPTKDYPEKYKLDPL